MAIIDQIIKVESGGRSDLKNPRSSASGLGQFIDSTWLTMIKQHRPDVAAGKSNSELLALKSDPALSREMTAAYAADNGAILERAGHQTTPGNTYLAHFAGPQGAVKVLNANPNESVANVLGQGAVDANPFLRGMTAGDLQAWADRKMGGAKAAPTQTAAVAPQDGPVTGTQAIPPQPNPVFTPQRERPTGLLAAVQGATQPPQQGQQQVSPQQQQEQNSLLARLSNNAPPPNPAAAAAFFAQIPVQQIQEQPIFYAPRQPVSVANLKSAFNHPTYGWPSLS